MRDPCWGKEGTKGGRHGLQGVKGSHGGQLGMVASGSTIGFGLVLGLVLLVSFIGLRANVSIK